MRTHTLSVLVENKPAVLSRVAALFSRRGFNIESLAVGPTEQSHLSRMTIVVSVEDEILEQVVKQLNKLINVIKVVELDPAAAVQRELVLVKVRTDSATRTSVLEVVQLFRGHVVDVATDAVTAELTGSPSKLAAFTAALEPYGIREVCQSGVVALARGAKSMTTNTNPAAQLRSVS